MAYGIWHMAHGIWHMAYGIWHMAYGIWHMSHGIWHMVYGIRHMAHVTCIYPHSIGGYRWWFRMLLQYFGFICPRFLGTGTSHISTWHMAHGTYPHGTCTYINMAYIWHMPYCTWHLSTWHMAQHP